MNVLLQPCSKKVSQNNFEKTIENYPIQLINIKEFLDEDTYTTLKEIYLNGRCMIWGLQAGVVKQWDKIDVGDISYFYKDKKMFFSAIVTYKICNEELSKYLWGDGGEKGPWSWIYFVNEPNYLNIDILTFAKVIYENIDRVQGFRVLNPIKSELVLNAFAMNKEDNLEIDVSKQQFVDAITKEDEEVKKITGKKTISKTLNMDLDKITTTTRRTEQAFLRNELFRGKLVMRCSICGQLIPIEFLWCSHIKKREFCSLEEKIDYENIVTPMCKFGCDDLYERGFIAVEDGKIVILKYTGNDHVDTYLKTLDGKVCQDYKSGNKKYYDEHRQLFTTKNNINT